MIIPDQNFFIRGMQDHLNALERENAKTNPLVGFNRQVVDQDIVCIHHRDPDGFMSAAIVKDFFRGHGVECISIQYGEDLDLTQFTMKTVFIVDYCFAPKEMWRLHNTTNLFWIDHHIGAINSMKKELPASQIAEMKGLAFDGLAGCELTYIFLHGLPRVLSMPVAIQYVGAYDVARYRRKGNDFDQEIEDMRQEFILPFQFQTNGMDMDVDGYVDMLGWTDQPDPDYAKNVWPPLSSHLFEGRAVWQYVQTTAKQVMQSNGFAIEIDGVKLAGMTTTMRGADQFGDILDRTDAVAVMAVLPTTNGVTCSFYSPDNSISVVELAQKFGGNGHKFAAGCQMSMDDYIKNIFNKRKDLKLK